ncbi:MAG TPA: hypothetical protein VEB69_15375 [Acidimicrobiia bacterium]|nr:hypothetical protein [Acidimicrobiia bacterium]
MPVVVASDQGGMVAIYLVLVAGAVMLASTPVTASIAWLKGKRIWATAGLVAGLMALAVLASRGRMSDVIPYADAGPMVAAPVALMTAVAAIRLARPGSWWARRFYDAPKIAKAKWAYATPAGRRRRLWTSAAVTLSIVLALVAVPLIQAGIADLLNTSTDELYSDVALYVVDDDPAQIEEHLRATAGPGLVSLTTEPKGADLGERSRELLADPLVAGCLLHEASHTIWMTVDGTSDSAVDAVLGDIGTLPGLVWVASERGRPDEILGVPHLDSLEEDWDSCQRSTILARIATDATEHERHSLAQDLREIPGVLAVAEPVWRSGEEGFARFPALVECYGPIELTVLVDGDVAGVDASVSSTLEADGVVEEIVGPRPPGADGDLEVVFLERPECIDLSARLLVGPSITDAQAAVIIAEAKAVPSVARVTPQLTALDNECIEYCEGESGIEILLGDSSTESLEALARSICQLQGVIGLVSYEAEGIPPCPGLWVQARIDNDDSGQVAAVEEILAGSSSVARTWTYEREDESGPTIIHGSRDSVACDLDGAFAWRVNADLVRGDEMELTRLIAELLSSDGVVALVGTATTIPGHPEQCGHSGFRAWLSVDSTSSDHDSIAATLSQFPNVLAAALIEREGSVHTDAGGEVGTAAELEVYFADETRDGLYQLMQEVDDLDVIVQTEPMDSYGVGHRP